MCYHHPDPIALNMLILATLALFAYTYVQYAKGNPARHLKWKNKSIKTKLTSEEFVRQVNKICLHKGFLLMDISPTHAFIKQNASFFHWGAYYYIELNEAEETTVTVWCRGGLYDFSFRLIWITDMVNLFYKN